MSTAETVPTPDRSREFASKRRLDISARLREHDVADLTGLDAHGVHGFFCNMRHLHEHVTSPQRIKHLPDPDAMRSWRAGCELAIAFRRYTDAQEAIALHAHDRRYVTKRERLALFVLHRQRSQVPHELAQTNCAEPVRTQAAALRWNHNCAEPRDVAAALSYLEYALGNHTGPRSFAFAYGYKMLAWLRERLTVTPHIHAGQAVTALDDLLLSDRLHDVTLGQPTRRQDPVDSADYALA